MQASEHQIQKAFFDWVRAAEKVYPELKLVFAVPNAGKRSYKIAAMLKAEGMRKGLLDVIVAFGRQGYAGMVIEFKKPGCPTTTEQDEYIEAFKKEGWLVLVLTDAETAIGKVKEYMGIYHWGGS